MIDFELPAELVVLRDRVEAFIADKIVPYENDPRQTAHGAPESLRRELVGLARQARSRRLGDPGAAGAEHTGA